jgi:hypothetical protein
MDLDNVPEGLDRVFTGDSTVLASDYVGLLEQDARAQADVAGVQVIRVVSLDAGSFSLHADHRRNRLNLLILKGESGSSGVLLNEGVLVTPPPRAWN